MKYWGQSWRSGTKCDCKTNWLWFRSSLEEMKYLLKLYFYFFALVSRQSAAVSSETQHAMPSEFGRKWGTECLNTRFPLSIPLGAGYSMIFIFNEYWKGETFSPLLYLISERFSLFRFTRAYKMKISKIQSLDWESNPQPVVSVTCCAYELLCQ